MPAMMFLAASMQVSRRESTAVLPIWGVTTRLSRVSRGSSGLMGSGSVTSIPAAVIQPSLSAVYSARESTTPPRATLIRMAVGFICRSSRSPM